VEKSYIGIRLADGRFFPIFDRNQLGRKRLVLTTVKDNQASVQIDLYRGIGQEMSEAEYVGTLVIQNVEEAGAGEPEISLVLGVDDSGNLNATAADEKSGEYESLSVSLESEVETESGDFELTDSDLDLDLGDEEGAEEAPSFEEAGLGDLELDEPEFEESATTEGPTEESAATEAETAEETSLEDFPDEMELEDAFPEGAPSRDASSAEAVESEDFSFDEDEEDELDLGDLSFDDETTSEEEQAEESLDVFDTEGLDEEAPAAAENDELEYDISDDFDYAETPPQFEDHHEERGESEHAAPATLGAGNILLFVAFMVLSLAGLGLLTYLIFQALRGPELPPLIGSVAAQVVDLVRGALTLL
jgi:molecular chaperone DnaK (HSP70)